MVSRHRLSRGTQQPGPRRPETRAWSEAAVWSLGGVWTRQDGRLRGQGASSLSMCWALSICEHHPGSNLSLVTWGSSALRVSHGHAGLPLPSSPSPHPTRPGCPQSSAVKGGGLQARAGTEDRCASQGLCAAKSSQEGGGSHGRHLLLLLSVSGEPGAGSREPSAERRPLIFAFPQ